MQSSNGTLQKFWIMILQSISHIVPGHFVKLVSSWIDNPNPTSVCLLFVCLFVCLI